MIWALTNAKREWSKVVRLAQDDGPQVITVRGREEAVVISLQAYQALVAADAARLAPLTD